MISNDPRPPPLVLIGGSAGSLGAIRKFFTALGAQAQAAYVVVQHLSPSRRSQLPSLVGKWTPMPVRDAVTDVPVEPNSVYVCPSGHYLSVRDGRFMAEVPRREEDRFHPIDSLCDALAAKYPAKVALVVLSGTGRDGTEGARMIKAAGGLVIVQDSSSAAFDGMPVSVNAAGLADAVLAPRALAATIGEWLSERTASLAAHSRPADLSGEHLDAILELLKVRAGRDLRDYRLPTLRRRVQRRMGLLGIEDLEAYLRLVRDDADELARLGKDLVIGVTSFFRDREAFEILERIVVPAICANKRDEDQVRVWIAGCSTGEEVYSAAILFLERLRHSGKGTQLKVLATDLDGAVLDVARAGRYPAQALTGVSAQRLAEYFDRDGDAYRIKKEVRELIVFAAHNLISDSPYSRLDLIVCRNVLIYLNRAVQTRVLSMLHYALNRDGYIFLGKAETLGNIARHFETVSKTWRIYRRTGSQARAPRLPTPRGAAAAIAAGGGELRTGTDMAREQEVLYGQLLAEHGIAQALLNAADEVLFVLGDSAPYLRLLGGRLSKDIFSMLAPDHETALRLALLEARKTRTRRVVNVAREPPQAEGKRESVRIEVNPFHTRDHKELVAVAFTRLSREEAINLDSTEVSNQWALEQLNQELAATREDLRRTIDQARVSGSEMRSANEEILSMNEELQSTNEELESSKEELQSLNEELITANAALDAKVVEVESLNADLRNLFDAAQMPMLLLDSQLRIRRFTPTCRQVMRIGEADAGRALHEAVLLFNDAILMRDCERVLRGGTIEASEIEVDGERWFMRRTLPYRSAGGDVSGVVITFADITQLKRSEIMLQERAARLQWQSDLLTRAAPIVGRDLRDRIIFWNKGAEALYGWSQSEALGQISDVLLRTVFPDGAEAIRRELDAHGIWKGKLHHHTREGRDVIVESRWTYYRGDADEPQAIVEVNNDVTTREEALEALSKSEAMFHTMIDWTYNLEYWIGTDGKLVYVSPSAQRLTGYTDAELLRNPALLDAIVADEDAHLWANHVHRYLQYESSEVSELTLRITRKNGEIRWVNHICRPVTNGAGAYLGRRVTVRDVTEQKIAEAQIRELAYFDPLTRLPNRRLLMDRLGQALISSNRSRQLGALIMLDIDHFKSLNDTQGHDAGDRLLVEVSRRLTAGVRLEDTVARLGGDEFIVMVESLGQSEQRAEGEAQDIAEKVRQAVMGPDPSGVEFNSSHKTTASIGVTLFRGMEYSPEIYLKQADIALYQAKDAGRNVVRYFNPAMQAAIERRTGIESALRLGLQREEFRLYYQPQVDGSQNIVGAEALIRWLEPNRGLVYPGTFIPVAEQSGLIVEIGRWVMGQACAQIQRWRDSRGALGPSISVNVSAQQFYQPDFVDEVLRALAAAGADPSRLKIELTESVVLDRMDEAVARMRTLIACGVEFSLDDFGTGYSSLSYLKRLPIAQVKIDKSFIGGLPNDPNDVAIVRAILAMARTLNLGVVAEGVESAEQRDFLLQLGCSMFQGDFFGPPRPIEQW
jgi:two-component system, chemotaxis family, CheB/CheR fusion protein